MKIFCEILELWWPEANGFGRLDFLDKHPMVKTIQLIELKEGV